MASADARVIRRRVRTKTPCPAAYLPLLAHPAAAPAVAGRSEGGARGVEAGRRGRQPRKARPCAHRPASERPRLRGSAPRKPRRKLAENLVGAVVDLTYLDEEPPETYRVAVHAYNSDTGWHDVNSRGLSLWDGSDFEDEIDANEMAEAGALTVVSWPDPEAAAPPRPRGRPTVWPVHETPVLVKGDWLAGEELVGSTLDVTYKEVGATLRVIVTGYDAETDMHVVESYGEEGLWQNLPFQDQLSLFQLQEDNAVVFLTVGEEGHDEFMPMSAALERAEPKSRKVGRPRGGAPPPPNRNAAGRKGRSSRADAEEDVEEVLTPPFGREICGRIVELTLPGQRGLRARQFVGRVLRYFEATGEHSVSRGLELGGGVRTYDLGSLYGLGQVAFAAKEGSRGALDPKKG